MKLARKIDNWPDRLIRSTFAGLRPYAAPSTPAAMAAETGIAPERLIKLDQNENPFGCPEVVRRAISESQSLNRYPDPEARECRAAIAGYAGAPVERIAIGNGSDELIEILARMLVEPGDAIVTAIPSFGYYRTVAEVNGAEYRTVERDDNWQGPVDKLLNACERGAKLLLLGSPNNPTANTVSRSDLLRLVEAPCLVVVDEAYFEFSRQTALDLALTKDNVVILRSFSKWAGLAGLRIGYGILPAWLMPYFWAIKPPYSVNVAAQVAAIASIEHAEQLHPQVQLLIRERGRLLDKISAIHYLKPSPSEANFILCRTIGVTGADLWDKLLRRGILVRKYSDNRLKSYIRFSVGRPEENDQLIAALLAIGEETSVE